ncbi:hypothetical protein R1flu_024309 [Riccia fluitans]|uniref:Mitochondrial carrier protein n=1 Tax=Riccia fluitans TaxID=41844 RepID=A0ABD1XUJ1_9MARC
MGQKKLRFRSEDEDRISGVDEGWELDSDSSFVGRVYAMVRGVESGSVPRRSAAPRSCRQDVKISFISLPLGDVRDVETKYVAARLPWRWSWRLWLPFFDDAEPGEAETALNHVYAGTMARTVSQVGIHPVDTVKTRMQVRDPPKKLRKWRQNISANAIGLGPVGVDNWLLKGPGDLFRGVTGAILGTIPNALLYFAAYEASKRKLKKLLPPNWDGPIHVASASIGTVVASIVRVPADTMKHRVQAYMHSNVFEAFGSIVAGEGIGGLYRGFWPTLMRDVPEIAIQFGVYEKLRSYTTERRKVSKLTTPEHLLLGAFAGAIAATCTMPLDLVKTRQQCGVSASIPSIVISVIHEKGVRGLFTGLGSRVLHVSLMSALFFSLFEYCKLVLKPGRDQYDSQIFPKIMMKTFYFIVVLDFVPSASFSHGLENETTPLNRKFHGG